MKLQMYRSKILFEKNGIEIFAVLLNVIMFILGGLLLARWFWVFFAPATLELPAKLEVTTSAQLTNVLAAHWFSPATTQAVMAAPTVNFKLVGIYAPTTSKAGFAVFKFADSKQKAVLIHQEINSGIALQNIQSDSVEVGQPGNTQTLFLDNPNPAIKDPPKTPTLFKNLQ